LNSCSNSEGYKIKSKFKSVIDNESCKIEYNYPEFISNDAKIDATDLNELFAKITDYQYYSHGCDEKKNEKRLINGDYRVTLETKDVLSIEFLSQFVYHGGNKMDTIYHSLVLNPKRIGEKEFAYFQSDLKFLIPNFDRGTLYKYVKEYNMKNENKVNLLAYESGSNYVITWGLTENDFLLYVGGEGEWFGYDKIQIPISELKKESNR